MLVFWYTARAYLHFQRRGKFFVYKKGFTKKVGNSSAVWISYLIY